MKRLKIVLAVIAIATIATLLYIYRHDIAKYRLSEADRIGLAVGAGFMGHVSPIAITPMYEKSF